MRSGSLFSALSAPASHSPAMPLMTTLEKDVVRVEHTFAETNDLDNFAKWAFMFSALHPTDAVTALIAALTDPSHLLLRVIYDYAQYEPADCSDHENRRLAKFGRTPLGVIPL